MPRRHTSSDGYDDPRDRENRHDSRGSRQQQITRDLRERRYPTEQRVFADRRGFQQTPEIRVARSPREPREPRGTRNSTLGREPTDNRHDVDTEDVLPRETTYRRSIREPRRIAASAASWDERNDPADTRDIRLDPDSFQVAEAMNDPRFLGRSRVGRNERHVQGEQEYRGIDQQNVRNDSIGQRSLSVANSQDSIASPVYNRINRYFLPAEGINPEVITADITRYLGPYATCQPHVNREARITRTCRISGLKLTVP